MKNSIWFLLMTIMVAMIVIGLMASCTNKIAKAKDALDNNPIEAAKYCAEKYPVKEIYLPGDSVITYDTLWGIIVKDDTITVETKDTVYRTITKTLPAKIVTKTVTRIDTVIKENKAKVEFLTLEVTDRDTKIAVTEAERDSWKKKAKQRFWWLLIIVATFTGFTGFTFRNSILKIFKK